MSQPVIVISRPLPELITRPLAELGEIRFFDAENAQQSLDGASVWVGTAIDPVSADLMQHFPASLGLIANIGVGTDNIDLQAASARSIYASNTPVVTEDTADLAMALMLATCRRLSVCERLLRSGDFAGGASQLGKRMNGKTLGIIGFGAIGQAVARRAKGFGMQILYTGPNRKQEAELSIEASYRADLETLLAESDIVSLHCSLNDSTRHILNSESLSWMKPGTMVINTGRGPLIDEAALVAMLASGHLGGAGLDVFEFEPEVTAALYEFENVNLLPHIGSSTGECRMEMAQRVAENVKVFLDTGHPLDPVNLVDISKKVF